MPPNVAPGEAGGGSTAVGSFEVDLTRSDTTWVFDPNAGTYDYTRSTLTCPSGMVWDAATWIDAAAEQLDVDLRDAMDSPWALAPASPDAGAEEIAERQIAIAMVLLDETAGTSCPVCDDEVNCYYLTEGDLICVISCDWTGCEAERPESSVVFTTTKGVKDWESS